MTDHITASPLTWPEGWKREKQDQRARFYTKTMVKSSFNDSYYSQSKQITIAKAVEFTLDELRKMGIHDNTAIISTNLKLRLDKRPYSNQKEPDDKGVSVWWMDGKEQRVIALDKYDRIADNLYAIGKTIEAMRSIERWGGGEILSRTFTGFVALPSSIGWRSILGEASTLAEAKTLYKKRCSEYHPDKGGDKEMFQALQQAWNEAQDEFKND